MKNTLKIALVALTVALSAPPMAQGTNWHGAAPTTAMTHIAVQEAVDGKQVDLLEHVTDEQYAGEQPATFGFSASPPKADRLFP